MRRLFRGSPGPDANPVFPAGIEELYAGENPVVDICFVHGLTGDRERTWTAEGQARPWPEILLPPELPDARILTFGYDAYIVRTGVASRNGLNDHAINFLQSLEGMRVACPTRKLVFVAHSLGGLVCKKMLLLSRESPEKRFKNIADATIGVAFLGTPHMGASKATWAKAPVAALGIVKSRNVKLIDVLCTDDEFLEDVRDRFVRTFLHPNSANGPLEVACFFEELPVLGVGIIVDRKSATLGGNLPFSIHANHMEMVKFATAEEPGFGQLLGDLKRWMQTARPQETGGAPSMSPEDVSRYAKQCQASLKFTGMEARAGDIRLAAQGTCQWLLQNPKYLEWSTDGQGLFWIKGNPGSGKSTLLKHAYIHRQKTADELLLSFFFHDRGSELQKTPLGLYRTLAYQVLCTLRVSVVDLINIYQTHHALLPTAPIKIEDWVWTEEDLQQYIERAIPQILDARAVWLFVDALDEAGEKPAASVFKWLRGLTAVTTGSRFPFRLCVSCRPYPVITIHNYAFEVCVENENANDISTYVRQRLENELDGTSASAEEILDLIVSRAKGIFLWARLVVEDVIAALRRGKSPSAVRNVVNDTPGEVSALYERQIMAMQGDREGLELLEWVCFAMEPLSPDELRLALAIPPDCQHTSLENCDHVRDMRDLNAMAWHIRTASRGLVEISVPLQTHKKLVVQFIHQTAKEYVLSDGLAALHGGGLSPAEVALRAHAHLTKICLQHLTKDELIHSRKRRDEWPFFHYTVYNWTDHLRLADCNCQSDGNSDCTHMDDYRVFLRLLQWPLNNVIGRWAALTMIYPTGTTLLHVLASASCVSLLSVLFQQEADIDVDPRDEYFNTPLSLAAERGRETVARMLIENKVNVNQADSDGRTPLHFAASSGQKDIIRLLIENEAKVNYPDKYDVTPLRLAIPGHADVIRLLLKYRADPDSEDKSGDTPLMYAARRGFEDVVRLLLENDANPNYAGWEGETPLIQAAQSGHEAVVQLLLEYRANPNLTDKRGCSALAYALHRKREAVEKLLREAGGVASGQPKDE